jgi:hypothetical protein
MHNLDNKNKLLELLAQGATLITPNNRLSAALLQDFFAWCNNKTVDKPVCLPYSTLIINAWQQLNVLSPEQPHPILLNESQCQHLWRKIIKADNRFTYSEGLLKSVIQAWEHSQQWQINTEDQSFDYTPQTRQFQLWRQQFDQQLEDLGMISAHQLVPYLIKADRTLFTQPIIWVCFDDFNPQQLSLQLYLSNKGLTQYRYDLNDDVNDSTVLAAQNNKEEYQQLMAWLHLKSGQGEQRIGVVVPNLEQESRALQRVLLQHFDPALFNISLGQALSEFSLVAHALSWLNLDNKSLTHHQATLLLQSPYIGSAK